VAAVGERFVLLKDVDLGIDDRHSWRSRMLKLFYELLIFYSYGRNNPKR
jgi:hypothetical protein